MILTSDAPPLLAGRYRLDEEIGEGGMGVVFRAFDTRLQRTVAAKVAKGPLDDDAKARLLREAQTLTTLRHPAIVAALDMGEEDGEIFMIMDFVAGTPLHRWEPASLEAVESIANELCEALDHAHGRGVIHRDVKPENIIVTPEGHARLTDFGIALAVEGGDRLTRTGGVIGTPRYMAPEVLQGSPPAPAHDVYSLGLVLKELLGRTPTGGGTHAFSQVVALAAAPDPRDRFDTARSFARALRSGADTRVRAAIGPAPQVELWNPGLWLRPLAVLLALATAAALWAFLLSVTPRVLLKTDVGPLVMTRVQDLGDGRVVSTARFEIAAWLLAALFAAVGGALFAAWLTLLRRAEVVERTEPREAFWFFLGGFVNVGLWAVHIFLIGRDNVGRFVQYMPIAGGVFELGLLVVMWTAILECLRRGINPFRIGKMWLGGALMVIPPIGELAHYFDAWKP